MRCMLISRRRRLSNLALALTVIAQLSATGCGSPPASTELPDERQEKIQQANVDTEGRKAFEPSGEEGEPDTVTAAQNEELNQFFAALGTAFDTADADLMFSLLSIDLVIKRAIQSGIHPTGQQQQFLQGLEVRMRKAFPQLSKTIQFDQYRLVKVKRLAGGDVIAHVRFWDDDLKLETPMRWWLHPDSSADQKWTAYDYENFGVNLRMSTLMSLVLSDAGQGELPPWVKDVRDLFFSAQTLFQNNDPDTLANVRSTAKRVLQHRPPDSILGFVELVLASTYMYEGESEQALKHLEKMEQVDPGAPMIHWMRADNFHTLGQWDQALANIDKYVQLLGWDADLHQIAADSWLGKGDAERSRKHAEEGLALVPQSIGCLCSLAAACPAAEAPQVCQRIEKLDDPESGFESVIDYLMSIEDLDLARAYAAELKQAFPGSELNSYYDEELAGAGSP